MRHASLLTTLILCSGLAEPSISSSFSGEDWKKFIQEKILPSDAPKL